MSQEYLTAKLIGFFFLSGSSKSVRSLEALTALKTLLKAVQIRKYSANFQEA